MSENKNNDNVKLLKLLKVLINELKQENTDKPANEVDINDDIGTMLKYLQLMSVLEGNDTKTSNINEANIEKYIQKLKENTENIK
ncbi:hypothetical protein HANVADRAFT_54200 [Hanseniaspora valbyensis NRRL Y-1626]|uniref:Uncharacterized protein n=1 Tax=Hanseniaspora valbyensis NRRL Y-1626 TaxID=766949 RepID=A0A1B7T8C9_9ASCO|nr:hypothetical protein HANVADRAFT_54200 [Hanseniaspora valbyensis NRRL Y-1626]